MKKIFACVLTLLMLLSFCACDTDGDKEPSTIKPVEMDEEQLRAEWKYGVLTFGNGGTVELPCTMDEIVKSSGLKITDPERIKATVLKPEESADFYLAGDNIQMTLTFRNKTEEPLTADKATVVSYNYTNVNKNNETIKFAKNLTVNARRTDVEDALGLPDDAKSGDVSYTYVSRDENKRRVELRVNFNSSDLVNSVSFHIGAK